MPIAESFDAKETARRQWRELKSATLFALMLCCAIALSLNLVDPDLWGHVQYGEDWLAAGELPQTASHTFTAEGHPWINHENLAELAMAEGFRWLGPYGMLMVKCLLGVGILGAMVLVARRQDAHPLLAWAMMLLVARNLTAFFPMRPQLLSFVWCAVMLVMLDRAFTYWSERRQIDWRWLWPLPLLFVVWTNSHGGFVAGLCIVGAYFAGRMIELAVTRGRACWRDLVHLAAIGLGCLAATLVNPYGIGLHRWLAESLAMPRPEITEWLAPNPTDPVFWPFVALALLAIVCLVATQRRRDWTQIAILVLVGWQASLHLRHIAIFALLCGFWIPGHLQSAFMRLLPSSNSKLPVITLSPWLRRIAVVMLVAAIGMQSYLLTGRLFDFPVRRDHYPVDAVQFMADHHLDGKLVVCFNWAQYAIAALEPDVQVGFDGRFRTCYPQEVVDMHFDFLLGEADGMRSRSPDSGPVDGTRVLQYGQPDMVLVDRRYKNAVGVMKAEALSDDPEWTLLYCDRTAELWGRRERYNRLASPHYFPLALRVLDPEPRDGAVQWPALPEREETTQLAEAEPAEPAHTDN